MLYSTRFLNKLNRSIHMYLIHTPNPGQILGLFRFSVLLSTPVADSKLIGPLVHKWEHGGAVDPGQQQTNIRVLANFFLGMLKLAIFVVLAFPSIRAALSSKKMTSALIAADKTGTLEKTFKTFEKEQDKQELAEALVDVASVPARMPKVVHCLRVARDSFPKDKMCVSGFVDCALYGIVAATTTESFTSVLTSLKPSDIKLLTSIRYWILQRKPAVDILKRVMDKSPGFITDDLPNWLASHRFDRGSPLYEFYRPTLEKSFEYLTSFATEDVLEKALAIVKRNEHYRVDSRVECCKPQDHFPQDLFNRINDLLELVKARNVLIKEVLTFLPEVLVDLMLEYHIYETI